MKKLASHKGEMKLETQDLEDIWYLSQVIDPGDHISGKTFRKIKLSGEEEKTSVERKPIFLEIKVEKVEFSNNILRVKGTVTSGPDDVPLGSYHTFSIDEGTIFKLRKEQWLGFQKEKIKEATEGAQTRILMVVFDREEAYFAMLKKYGYEFLSSIQGNVSKKDYANQGKGDFYSDIKKQIVEYDARYNLTHIIVGSPAFWSEELTRLLDSALKKKVFTATVQHVGRSGFSELLKREEVQRALKDERVAKEMEAIESLMQQIAKGNAAYGLEEVDSAVTAGAVQTFLVTDSFIWKAREEGYFTRIENMMRTTDKQKGTILIISHEHEGGSKLDGLGGIAALLRFPIH
ncbi:MAG: mRNA surveillance protein pelota [Candidatus Woesearchaeota archaeon]